MKGRFFMNSRKTVRGPRRRDHPVPPLYGGAVTRPFALLRRCAVVLAVACALAWSQGRTGLNGVWKMDPGRSDFGPGPVSESRLDRITVDGANMKDTITQALRGGRETTYDMIYTLDGKECVNHVNGRLVKSTARWDGQELVVDSRVFAIREADMNDHWSVSSDGTTLTIVRHITGARRADQKIVFARQ